MHISGVITVYKVLYVKCPRCGKDVNRSWDFCPHCGAMLTMNLIPDIMAKMSQQMREMNKEMHRAKKDFEVFDLSPYFKKGKGTGFSIKIVQTNQNRPKISVKTFGNIDRQKLEKQIYKQLGTIRPATETKRDKKGFLKKLGISKDGRPETRRETPVPKKTEEPKTEIKKLGSKVVVNMDMPGVRSEKDVEVRELENSLEVRAIAGDKAYFKILTKPGQFRLLNKRFSKGRLHLEFS